MAGRTVSRFNEAATKDGRDTVVTWCASCHMHMSDIMAPGNTVAFDITHISELLVASIDRLAPLLTVPVPRRVLLHRHLGFSTHVPINDRIANMLSQIPGLELIEGPAIPGHMCSGIAAVPGALKAVMGETWSAAIANRADTMCTIFHPCHREFAALDGRNNIRVRNWVQLVAEAMGIEASDAYVGWRNGATPDIAAIERAEPSRYQALIEPELRASKLPAASVGVVE